LEGPALPMFGYSEPFTQYTGRYYQDLVPEGRQKAFKKVIDRVVYGEHVRVPGGEHGHGAAWHARS